MARVTLTGADEAIAQLESQGRKGAIGLRQAINDTARFGRAELVRSVTSSLNLRAAYVRERVGLRLAYGSTLEAVISARRRDVLLNNFDARQVYSGRRQKVVHRNAAGQFDAQGTASRTGGRQRAGVSVRVARKGPRKRMPGAFFVTLKNSGARAVAVRDPRGGTFSTGKPRFEVEYGPSVFQHFRLIRPELRDALADKLIAEATRQYERRLPR